MHTTMRALYNAQKAYQMENDTYTWDLTELPLDFPGYTFTSYLGFTNSVLKNNDFLVAFNYPNTPDKTFIYGVPTRGCQSSTQLRAFNNSCYVLTLDMINGNITCADGTKEPVKMSCKTIGY